MFLYLEREKITKRLEKRKAAAIACANPYYRRVDDVVAGTHGRAQEAPVIDMVSDSDEDSQATMVYPETMPPAIAQDVETIPIATDVEISPTAIHVPAMPVVQPAQLHEVSVAIAELWHKVKSRLIQNGNEELDHGMCADGKCIYCRGGPLRQMHSLMERLIQLEKFLWSEPSVDE